MKSCTKACSDLFYCSVVHQSSKASLAAQQQDLGDSNTTVKLLHCFISKLNTIYCRENLLLLHAEGSSVNFAFFEGFNNGGLWQNIFFQWNLQEILGKLLCIIAYTGIKQLLFVFFIKLRKTLSNTYRSFLWSPFSLNNEVSLSLWAHRLSNCHILCRVTFNLPIHLFPLLQIRA